MSKTEWNLFQQNPLISLIQSFQSLSTDGSNQVGVLQGIILRYHTQILNQVLIALQRLHFGE